MDQPVAPPRLDPLEPPYAPEMARTLAAWMPADSPIEPLNLFRTLVLHDQLASRMRAVGAGILGAGAVVRPRLREVMIQRTCALTGARYEWGVHASAFAESVGLDETQLRSTVLGSAEDACWDREETCVLRLAQELHETNTISDELWAELRILFEDPQIIELMVTAGWYHVIAYVCNGARVQYEEWAAPYPISEPPIR